MKLALGTAQFGPPYGISNQKGVISKKEVERIINLSRKIGIDTIDTAKSYGKCEELLGDIGVKDFKIITKLSSDFHKSDNATKFVNIKVEESLQKLRINNLHAILFHDSSFYKNIEGIKTFRILEKLKYDGKIKKIGVSVYNPDDLKKIINQFNIDIVQLPLNLLDRRFEKEGLLKELNHKKIEIHSRSTFLQGLLLMKKEDLPSYFFKWKNIFEYFEKWIEIKSTSKIKACLNYPVSLSMISKIIVGVISFEQLEELNNIYKSKKVSDFPIFPDGDYDLIDPRNWKNN